MGHWLGQRLGYGTGLRSVQRLGKWLGHGTRHWRSHRTRHGLMWLGRGTRHGLKWLKWLKWLNWVRSWLSGLGNRLRHRLSGLGSRLRHRLSRLGRLSGVLRHRLTGLETVWGIGAAGCTG